MIQSQDHLRRELEALYNRVGNLKRRKAQTVSPSGEVMDEAFAEIQTMMEELKVAEENLREQNLKLAHAAQRLEAERQRYEDLFEFAPDGYLVTNVRGVILEANRAAEKLLRQEKALLIGTLLTDFLPFEEHAELIARLEGFLLFPPTDLTQSWETCLSLSEETFLEVSLTVSAIRGKASSLAGLRWMLRDITERKQAEAMKHVAVLEERNRIAQELHDTLAQGFTGIAVQLEAAEDVLSTLPDQAQAHLARARSLARESLAETRRSVWGLRPHALQSGDLAGALAHTVSEMTSGTSLHMTYHTVGVPYPLPGMVEDNLLRICQEALTNVLKHAQARMAKVELSFLPEQVQLRITDDGNGLAQARSTRSGGFGLAGMRERAERIGGEFCLKSQPKRGTTIGITLARSASANTSFTENEVSQ